MFARWLLFLGLALTACGTESTTGESAGTQGPTVAPGVTKAPPDVKFDAASLKADADDVALVPSPAEMQRTLKNSGLTTRLADLVKDRDYIVAVENKDQTAVRTGVLLADLVLTLEAAPTDQVIARLEKLKQGFSALGAGEDVDRTIDDVIARLKSDAVSRDDLVREMDDLAGVMVPELEFEGRDWVVPLIQAGSWLEGAHLVAAALQGEGKYDATTGLLRQPQVVDHFLRYVQHEGRDKAPDEVISKLEETLKVLKEVTGKPTLGAEDIETIHSSTGAVLALL